MQVFRKELITTYTYITFTRRVSMILTDFMNSLISLTSILASSRALFCSSFSFLSCFILCCSLETNSPEKVDNRGIMNRKIIKGIMKPILTNENLISFSGSIVTEWLGRGTRHRHLAGSNPAVTTPLGCYSL